MPPRQPRSRPVDPEQLPATDHMDRIAAAIEAIAIELRMIRETVDRLFDDFEWALNNDRLRPKGAPLPIVPLTSMPLDPLAPDFGERTNKYSAKDLVEPEAADAPASP